MKKESLIAVVLGLTFGLIFSIILIQSNKKPPKETKEININSSLKSPTIIPVKDNKTEVPTLTITSPQDNLITSQNRIEIKGEAPKNSLIIIQNVNNEKIFENKNKKFTVEIPLNYGANQLTIFAYPKNIQTALFKKLTIYYLENKL